MEEGTTTKIEKAGWGIIKWTLGILATIGILGTTFWLLFYSVYFANLSFIIPLRNWYQNTYWSIEGLFLPKQNTYPPFDPVYTFQVQKWEDTYVYVFWGQFSKVDSDKELIYINGYNGKTYTFKTTREFANQTSDTLFPTPIEFSPKSDIVSVDSKPFTSESIVKIVWDDKRTLKRILDDYSKDPYQPLNFASTRFFSFAKYN